MARNGFRSLKLAVFIGCLIASCVPSLAQRGWNLPEDEWVFRTLYNLKDSGLVTDQYFPLIRSLPTRRSAAFYTAFVHDELLARADEMNRDLSVISRKPITYKEAIREAQTIKEKAHLFSTHREDIHALRRVIEKLRPELTSMGHDVDELLVGIAVAATRAADVYMRIANAGEQRELQFRDVPTGHWVYDALEEGRNRRFFFGYPNELFRGGQPATRYEMAGAVNGMYQEVREEVMALQDELDARFFSDPGGPEPPSFREMARSLARFNWTLKHRRELTQFFQRF